VECGGGAFVAKFAVFVTCVWRVLFGKKEKRVETVGLRWICSAITYYVYSRNVAIEFLSSSFGIVSGYALYCTMYGSIYIYIYI